MTTRPEFPAWLVYDAMGEADGMNSPAFQKAMKAVFAWEEASMAWMRSFEAEFLKHHTIGNKVTPPCAEARKVMPKYRKSNKRALIK